jgi:flagellar hook-length control protein FliK
MKAAADLPPGMKVSIETSANAQANAKPDTGAPSQAGSNQAQTSATGSANSAAALNGKAPEPVPAQLPSQAAPQQTAQQTPSQQALSQAAQQAAQQAQPALEGAQQRAADTGSPNSPASQNAANQSANAQNAGNQNPGNQNPGNQNPGAQQQGANAQPTFQFGQASFGGNTPEAAASRAQFQQIMATRTARPAPLGATSTSSNALGAGQSGLTSSPIAAGPGGPQSTFSASLASQVAQATPGRSSATPGTAVDQVAVKLSSSAKDGGGKISIKLNPEELGRVDVKLDIGRDGIVRATVMADRPETLDLLQRDARGLERALQEAGLKTDGQSLNFEGQQQREANERGQSDRAGGSNGNPDDGTADDLADANTTDTESGPSDDGSLNLVA